MTKNMKAKVIEIADFSASNFASINSITHPTRLSVMPVVAIKNEQLRILGTCFAISNQGLVITARHVIEDVILLKNESSEDPHNEWQIGALYIADGTNYEVPDLFGGLLLARQIYTSPEIDIGIMSLNLMAHRETGEPIPMPILTLSPGLPNEGDTCLTLGYHNPLVEYDESNPYIKLISMKFSASKGTIEQLHFPRRDSAKLRWPCFQTSLRHEPAMSGAPIVSVDGGVIGIVCSAIDGTDIYYGSLIGPSLFLQIEAVKANGTIGNVFLYDFITGGAVIVDKSIEKLRFSRHDDVLEINFGLPPVFKGQLTP